MGHAKKSKDALQWWIQNLKYCSSRSIIHHDCFVTIKTYASKSCSKVKFNVISQIHLQICCKTVLTFLQKMEDTGNKKPLDLSIYLPRVYGIIF